MENKIENPHKLFTPLTFLAIIIFFAVIISNFYFLYWKKNYDFIVETACDPALEICLERDCSEEGSCPPNNLSVFKRFSLNADDFKSCENEDCALACESNIINCEPIECVEDIDYGETCTFLVSTEEEPVLQ